MRADCDSIVAVIIKMNRGRAMVTDIDMNAVMGVEYNETLPAVAFARCSNHGYYDPVVGCVCYSGWTGGSLATSELNNAHLIYIVMNLNRLYYYEF